MEKEYSFSGQRPDEKVVELAYNHPYVLYPSGLRTVLLFTLAVLLIVFFKLYWISLILILFGSVYFFNSYYGFKESILIITNQRILHVEQWGFFRRRIAETDLCKILDISSDSQGFTKTLLKYGDLIVQVSGAKEKGDIIVKDISHPYYFQQEITRLMQEAGDGEATNTHKHGNLAR